MNNIKQKLYCYVDETGQDTKGAFFLVVVVLNEQQQSPILEQHLEQIEQKTKKKKLKWVRTPFSVRTKFLEQVINLKGLKTAIFYAVYKDTKTYIQLLAFTVAKAIFAKQVSDYSVNIIIDGLTKKDTEKIRLELKKLKVKYKHIRGMKDEQSSLLRLADSLAGLLRDYTENQSYAKPLFKKLKEREVLIEA